VSLPLRRPGRPHLFITHEFYPKRGGIATFVEEIARAGSACSVDADAGSRVPHVIYPLTRGGEDVISESSPSRKDAQEGRADELAETQTSEVEVWAQALPRGSGRGDEKDFPFRVRRLPLRGTHNLGCLVALARVLFAERARLREASVYLVEPGPILAFLWLQFFVALRPRELCLTFHGSEILKLHRNPLRRVLARRLIARATRVSTLTHYTRDLLFECFPEARVRFVLTPGGVSGPFLWRTDKAGTLAADVVRSAACGKGGENESQQRLVVLTVGRLHPRKGQLHTLEALAALPPELQREIEYWLVGSAGTSGAGKRYEARLRELAAAAAPALAVRFLGDVGDDELGAIYAQADIFALTSVAHGTSIEGFGLVYLEAAAHGLPIVAHDIGGVAEAVCDGHTGLLVAPSDDPSALRDAFARLIEEPDLRARLGAAGPAWARRHSWADSAAALLGACRPAMHAGATLCPPKPPPLRGESLRPQSGPPSKTP